MNTPARDFSHRFGVGSDLGIRSTAITAGVPATTFLLGFGKLLETSTQTAAQKTHENSSLV
jgi:hypothetical protein